MKRAKINGILGALIFIAIIILGFYKLGWFPMLLFITVCAAGIQDAVRGRVIVFTFLPVLLVPVFYPWAIFMSLFLNVFIVLLIIWIVLHLIKKKRNIPEEILRYGFGDVLGVPYAFITSWVLLPFWGVVLFGASTAVLTLPMLRAKNRRLLPWLLPGLMACFVVAVMV